MGLKLGHLRLLGFRGHALLRGDGGLQLRHLGFGLLGGQGPGLPQGFERLRALRLLPEFGHAGGTFRRRLAGRERLLSSLECLLLGAARPDLREGGLRRLVGQRQLRGIRLPGDLLAAGDLRLKPSHLRGLLGRGDALVGGDLLLQLRHLGRRLLGGEIPGRGDLLLQLRHLSGLFLCCQPLICRDLRLKLRELGRGLLGGHLTLAVRLVLALIVPSRGRVEGREIRRHIGGRCPGWTAPRGCRAPRIGL